LYCSAVTPLLTGVVVRGGTVRRGGRLTGVLLRLDELAPPPVAAPEVVPPPMSCWAIATPADKKKIPVNAICANNRLIMGSTPCAKVGEAEKIEPRREQL
jgi:hypothetical protein